MGAPAITYGIHSLKKHKKDLFYKDVLSGLNDFPKHLSSKYFYDAKGDKIFQEIMNCREYYPTRCELEIFSGKTIDLGKAIIADGDAFDLIELGAGDATKSSYLLKYLLEQKADFTYLPIDISENVISYLDATLPTGFQQLMDAFNKMDPVKRKQIVNDALARMKEHEGEGPPPGINSNIAQHVVDQGIKSFYRDANADVKLDLAPLIEQMQRNLEHQ